MRKGFLLLLVLGLLGVTLPGVTRGAESIDPFQTAMNHYQQAINKRDSNDSSSETEHLKKSYEIFQKIINSGDDKPLILSYALFLRLKSLQVNVLFPYQLELEKYVKSEYKLQFPTLERIDQLLLPKVFKWDKKPVQEALLKMVERLQQGARQLLVQAREEWRQTNYNPAIHLLEQALEIWYLPDASELLTECRLLSIKSEQCRMDYDAAIAAKLFSNALDIIKNQAAGVLSSEEMEAKENNAKILWSSSLYSLADESYRKRKLTAAHAFIAESLLVQFTEKADNLMRDIQKRQKKRAFFIDMGLTGNFKMTGMNYNQAYNIPVVGDVTNENVLSGDYFKKKVSYEMGLILLFSPSSGIRVSVSSIRQNWKLETHYSFSWTWLDATSASSRNSMSENATGTLLLISLDYLSQFHIGNDLYLNLYVGPTIYHSKIDAFAGIGYGGIWVHSQDHLYYPEWFPFKYRVKEGDFGMGGNIGVGLEYKFPPASVFVECQYHMIPRQQKEWQLVNQHYTGKLGIFDVAEPLTLPNLPEYSVKMNLSTFKWVVGTRIYF